MNLNVRSKELRAMLYLVYLTSTFLHSKFGHMQIKFLSDVKKGVVKNHSRGVAFVEFAEHQHAIVALRVLNNNPGNFFSSYVLFSKCSFFFF